MASHRPNTKTTLSPKQLLFQFNLWLFLGYGCMGWVLCAYAVSKLIWLSVIIVVIHLIRVGFHAMVPAFISVTLILSVGAVEQVWMWQMPVPFYQLGPLILLLVWFFVLGLMLLTAIAHRYHLQQLSIAQLQRAFSLMVPIALGLVCGVCFYRLFTLPLLQA